MTGTMVAEGGGERFVLLFFPHLLLACNDVCRTFSSGTFLPARQIGGLEATGILGEDPSSSPFSPDVIYLCFSLLRNVPDDLSGP